MKKREQKRVACEHMKRALHGIMKKRGAHRSAKAYNRKRKHRKDWK